MVINNAGKQLMLLLLFMVVILSVNGMETANKNPKSLVPLKNKEIWFTILQCLDAREIFSTLIYSNQDVYQKIHVFITDPDLTFLTLFRIPHQMGKHILYLSRNNRAIAYRTLLTLLADIGGISQLPVLQKLLSEPHFYYLHPENILQFHAFHKHTQGVQKSMHFCYQWRKQFVHTPELGTCYPVMPGMIFRPIFIFVLDGVRSVYRIHDIYQFFFDPHFECIIFDYLWLGRSRIDGTFKLVSYAMDCDYENIVQNSTDMVTVVQGQKILLYNN